MFVRGQNLRGPRAFSILVSSIFLAACTASISGTVISEGNPVPGAVVRVQTSGVSTTTDQRGRFRLSGFDANPPIYITAWAPGYYIARSSDEVWLGGKPVIFDLVPHSRVDNPDYEWVSAYSVGGSDANCQNCHSGQDAVDESLPFNEWQHDAHASSATNMRFITMYSGTDVHGNQSPLTRKGYSRDYGSFPLRPDESLPYYGPGYKLDFPGSNGNCATCHVPVAAVDDPYGIDTRTLDGVEIEGLTCDFCHKIWDVKLTSSGMPVDRMPGVLSFEFLRPGEGHQFFAGPYDDVAPGEDTYLALQSESQFCAPCHYAVFWDTVIYNSYGEWLESPYSDPASGQTCQDCHMPVGNSDHFAKLESGGLIRDPERINSHLMLGASSPDFISDAVTMSISGKSEGGQALIEVAVTNSGSGHHLPTGSPLRQMILIVDAKDANGERLEQISGPQIPEWAGTGSPSEGKFAGLPGVVYAKILQELWTQVSPSGSYWNPTRVLSDNRIAALDTDKSEYRFELPIRGETEIEVKLIFRRAFIALMDQKGWDFPDILVAEDSISIP
jgi:hypothetical protein